jgi:hypothetical protein
LFGYLSNAEVKNVGLEGTHINVAPSSVSSIYFAGGIAGNAIYSTISDCYNTGEVHSYNYTGGILGSADYSIISNCYNTGIVTSISDGLAPPSAGGIAGGFYDSTISNCCNTGHIFSHTFAGGILGNTEGSAITNCYNTGDVSSNPNSSSFSESGGIAGDFHDSTMSYCYNAGGVFVYTYDSSSSYDDESYVYPSYAGGIAGRSYYNPADSAISYCVTLLDSISQTPEIKLYSYLIGCHNDGESIYTSNYAADDISGDAVNDADRLISRTEARMQSTYESLGWDFNTVWEMRTGYDYPQLRMLSISDGESTPTPTQPPVSEPTTAPTPTQPPATEPTPAQPDVSHTVTATAGTGGSVSPVGTVRVPDGADQTFVITPNAQYRISNVLVDGVSQGTVRSFTFRRVSGNHSIEAVFVVSVPSGGGGGSGGIINASGGGSGDSGSLNPPALSGGNLPESETTVPSVPTVPSDAAAEPLSLGVKLHWEPSDNPFGYNIYRTVSGSQNAERINIKPVFGGEFIDVTADSNTSYVYTFAAITADGGDNLPDAQTAEVITGEITGGIEGQRGFILMQIGRETMNVNGEIAEIDPGRGTAPLLVNGRTLLPIRAVIEAMGGVAEWNGGEQKILLSAHGHTLEMWVGREDMTADGSTAAMDVAPEIINDRTMLPLRFVAENTGCLIEWIGSTQEVVIVYPLLN